MRDIVNKITNLNRRSKQLIMAVLDSFLIPFSFLISIALFHSTINPLYQVNEYFWILFLPQIFTIPILIKNRLYRSVLKYMGYYVIIAAMKSITVSCIVLLIAINIFELSIPIPIILIYWFVSILVMVGSRYLLKSFIYYSDYNKKPIAIYGAGNTGAQLIHILKSSKEYIPVALFDDNMHKWGTVFNSICVSSPHEMNEIIKVNNIKLILFAITTLSADERKKILRKIANSPIEVRVITSLENIISGKINFNSVKKVDVLDILGREPVKPSKNLLNKNIKDKNILVTGAGGSIGSELCRQIIELNPKRLVLLDHSEHALYQINRLCSELTSSIEIIPILTTITNFKQITYTFDKYEINTVYHAAAYKHVPMVELNPSEGIQNNVLGTYNCAMAAMEFGVDTFILISSDKAVRPTNVMGATKRFSELVLQAIDDESSKTCFSMVRFGNVLDSAGSVVPLFREQINSGGPVTVTNREVTRYFMSIQEAVQLVIQAGAMAKGGDVFVLDMGEPIRIHDLAQKMIHLSGFQPITMENPDGDIEIKITGLRPGEKLFEELLLGNNVFRTEHSQIMQAKEKKIDWDAIEGAVMKIISASKDNDLKLIKEILMEFIDGYEPSIETFSSDSSSEFHQYIKNTANKVESEIKGLT